MAYFTGFTGILAIGTISVHLCLPGLSNPMGPSFTHEAVKNKTDMTINEILKKFLKLIIDDIRLE